MGIFSQLHRERSPHNRSLSLAALPGRTAPRDAHIIEIARGDDLPESALCRPGFANAAGLRGHCGAIFSVVKAVLLEPLPFRDPDELVMVWKTHPEIPVMPVVGQFESPTNFLGRDFGDAKELHIAPRRTTSKQCPRRPVASTHCACGISCLFANRYDHPEADT